jgi:hypothetical protein
MAAWAWIVIENVGIVFSSLPTKACAFTFDPCQLARRFDQADDGRATKIDFIGEVAL